VPAPALTSEEVGAFLVQRHGGPVTSVEVLSGGFWSSAFAYRVDDRELVARFGPIRAGFEADQMAMAFDGPDLPVPAVLEIGDAFGGAYAISVRHHGRFLETVREDEASVAGPTLLRLLAALHAVAAPPGGPVAPQPSGATAGSTWRRWIVDALVDDPSRPVHGWRAALAEDAGLDRLFRSCESRIHDLVESCPERRDVVHGDLLHGNVLISEDAARVDAVFSWKCSTRGDFLYDTAWCTFWGPWHPGIAAADVWRRILAAPWALADPGALADAALRHHCYELQIGATHLGWNAWTGNAAELEATAAHTAMVLERVRWLGPVPDDCPRRSSQAVSHLR